MKRFCLANPFVLHSGGQSDPAIRRELAREYVRRELPVTYSAQGVGLFLVFLGLELSSPAIGLLGLLRLIIGQSSRVALRSFDRSLDDAGDIDALIRRRTPFYATIGVTLAAISWPMFMLHEFTLALAILPVIAVVSVVVLATSVCFVPRLFTASSVGFSVGMLPVAIVSGGSVAVAVLAFIPVLQLLLKDLGTSNLGQLTDLLAMQFERDRVLAAQTRVIDELHAARQHASDLANTDVVTQLPNRQALLDHIDALTSSPDVRFTLMLVDLDYFKNINDTMGHNAGDAVLVELGQALRAFDPDDLLASGELFVARFGGDEFALVLPGEHAAARVQRAYERWLQRLERLPVPGIGHLSLTATCGSARFPTDGGDRRMLLNVADMALRAAKSACRGTHQSFQRHMTERLNSETRITKLLTQSIDERQFSLRLQPQVRMTDGTIVAAEALGRFIHPELARFPVQRVFDIAEDRGLGPRLSAALLAMTGEAVMAMQPGLARPIPIGVNLSPSTLKAPDLLLDQLRRWLDAGLSPERIKLELTEDAIAGRGQERIHETLSAIADMGFELALDDFGTGRASLTHLHRLPIHEMKIAREFVENVTAQRKDQAIVKSVVTMCEHMGIRCVVEGVETREQAQVLGLLGARYAQGYWWARPMRISEFLKLAEIGRCQPAGGSAPLGIVSIVDPGELGDGPFPFPARAEG